MEKNTTGKSAISKDMTKEQTIFYVGQKVLKKFEKIKLERPLTPAEKRKEDEVKQLLFKNIVRFGMGEANRRIAKYRIDKDARADIQQALALMFFDKLPQYDPRVSTPSTFFVRYFNQVISEYLLANSQHLSQYDAHNVSKVRGAIQYYESRNIQWDVHMIVNRTGLSQKVVVQTIHIAANSQRANIDDQIDLPSKMPTPEENAVHRDKLYRIINAINRTLSKDECQFFFYRMNLDGTKDRTYQDVANHYGMSVKDVKKQWSSITARLGNVSEIKMYRDPNAKKKDKLKVKLSEGLAAEELEKDLIDTIREAADMLL